MKTTVINKSSADCCITNSMYTKYRTGVCVHATYNLLDIPAHILYMISSYYVESNSVLVADGDTTFAVSPTRRESPQKDVWNVESPTKRLSYAFLEV